MTSVLVIVVLFYGHEIRIEQVEMPSQAACERAAAALPPTLKTGSAMNNISSTGFCVDRRP